MAKNFVKVEVKTLVGINIEEVANYLEDSFVDQYIEGSDFTLGDLDDDDYKRVLVAVCEAIIEKYKD